MDDRERKRPNGQGGEAAGGAQLPRSGGSPQLQVLSDRFADAVAQRLLQRKLAQRRAAGAAAESADVQAAAARSFSGSAGTLPHLGKIQESFGKHDVTPIQAHTDGSAMDAQAAKRARKK